MSLPPPQTLSPDQVQFLQQQGFSSGLIQSFAQNASLIALRWWVVDNSASMVSHDAHVITGSMDNIQMMDASRWEEVRRGVKYNAHVAGMFGLPTRFTMLNSTDPFTPQTFSVAERGPAQVQQDIHYIDQTLQNSFPFGATPLTKHLVHIRQAILGMSAHLQQERKRVTIVLTTDGLPSSEQSEDHLQIAEFVQAIRAFQHLPVWIVVRLCSDDEIVFDFYNRLDAQVDLPIDVLDDLVGEALEVYLHNPWLNYALPLHRMRELGFPHTTIDALDEHALTFPELWALCGLLFANHRFPDPAVDWLSFLRVLAVAVAQERPQWNPVVKVCTPWLDLARLHAFYGRNIAFPRDIDGRVGVTFPRPNSFTVSPQPSRHLPEPVEAPSFGYGQQPMGSVGAPLHPRADARPNNDCFSGSNPSHPDRQSMDRPYAAPPPSISREPPGTTVDDSTPAIKKGVLMGWALQPPSYQLLRPLDQLLASIQTTFPPANGVAPHSYFHKFKPFATEALTSRNKAVLKRAIRKVRFFLHPDKLPGDLTPDQVFLCKQLWDIIADASETLQSKE